MKTFLPSLLVSVMLCWVMADASAQQTRYSRVFYDNNGAAQVFGIARMTDGEYLLAGEKDNHPMFLRMSSDGHLLWDCKFGNVGGNFNSINSTADGGFILAGWVYDTITDRDLLFCLRLNSVGDTLWSRAIDIGVSTGILSIRETADNGFIASGYVPTNHSKLLVARLNSIGVPNWVRLMSPGDGYNVGNAVAEGNDGSVVVCGFMQSMSPYQSAPFAACLSSGGALEWARKIEPGTDNYGMVSDVVWDGNSFLMALELAGTTFLRMDLSGAVSWARSFPYFFSYNNVLFSPQARLRPTSDGGWLINTSVPWGFAQMMRLDANLIPAWESELFLTISDLCESPDGGVMVAGNGPIMGVEMVPTTNPQIGIIKTDTSGESLTCLMGQYMPQYDTIEIGITSPAAQMESVTATVVDIPLVMSATNLAADSGCVAFVGAVPQYSGAGTLQIVPNPNDGRFRIELEGLEGPSEMMIYNTVGELVYHSSDAVTTIDLSGVKAGMYLVRVKTGKGYLIGKFQIIK